MSAQPAVSQKRNYNRARYERAMRLDLCRDCVKRPRSNGRIRCEECLAKKRTDATCCMCGKPFQALKERIKEMGIDAVVCSNSCGTKKRWANTAHSIEDRYWRYVDQTPGQGPWGDCWGWKASKAPDGYGQLGKEYKGDGRSSPTRAHIVSYQIHYGPIPEGLDVCHKCDNPPCSKPEHLWLGTTKENINDAQSKGRMPMLVLDEVPLAELSTTDCLIEPTFERALDKQIIVQTINSTLRGLTDRQRRVIELRFGLNDEREHTLEEIGQQWSLTRERIRQIEAKALRRLRHPKFSKALEEFIAA